MVDAESLISEVMNYLEATREIESHLVKDEERGVSPDNFPKLFTRSGGARTGAISAQGWVFRSAGMR